MTAAVMTSAGGRREWTARQCELLAAMGYTVMQRRPVAGVASVARDPEVTAPAADSAPFQVTPLVRAVLRAAGITPAGGPEAVADDWLRLGLPAPESLRGAAGKRALWPHLRALRATRGRSS